MKTAFLIISTLLYLRTASVKAEFRKTGIKESCYMKIIAHTDFDKKYVNGTNWTLKDSGFDNHTIYVRHYVPHTASAYTNHFLVRNVDENGDTIDVYGGKWCTPKLNIPIQSDEIVMDQYYSIAARANTCHYQYDNIERLELRVNMYANMNTYPKIKEEMTNDDSDHAIFD